MAFPYHFSEVSPQLRKVDKASSEYQALSVIAESLEHPQRTILSTFIKKAENRELASQFFLNVISNGTVSEFLTDWVTLLEKVRPAICNELEESLKRSIWQRDGGQCCISKFQDPKKFDGSPLFVYILSPSLFQNGDVAQNARLHKLFAAYIGEPQLQNLRSLLDQTSCSNRDLSAQALLLSPRVFEHFKNGRLSLNLLSSATTADSAQYSVNAHNMIPPNQMESFDSYILLENKATDLGTALPSAQLLALHKRFADSWAWLEVWEYMKLASPPSWKPEKTARSDPQPPPKTSWSPWPLLRPVTRILQYFWLRLPVFFRAFAYRRLASIGGRLYGRLGSFDRTHRLPFNLYLRVDTADWARYHQAEFRALQLVATHTQIPVPRPLDTITHANSSFLLMTGLPGTILGRSLAVMTDAQIDAVVQDLKKYIAELRHIPNQTGSGFQICNPLGGGILDWRIADSKREELKFRDETEFHQYLRKPWGFDAAQWRSIAKAHGRVGGHEIVFTHADLNMRNILVDENNKISGIVDWECAGWYPEYWEYTKAHFTTRFTTRWIADVLDQVWRGYRDELVVENILTDKAPPW
ncbi:kinase-like domain-containing protein [Geopyxis carbonaria]|nr:kinase-like domain-containing protein [Geopyxis carbonaria]